MRVFDSFIEYGQEGRQSVSTIQHSTSAAVRLDYGNHLSICTCNRKELMPSGGCSIHLSTVSDLRHEIQPVIVTSLCLGHSICGFSV